eukprot:1403601-Rhodomonas_salina.2
MVEVTEAVINNPKLLEASLPAFALFAGKAGVGECSGWSHLGEALAILFVPSYANSRPCQVRQGADQGPKHTGQLSYLRNCSVMLETDTVNCTGHLHRARRAGPVHGGKEPRFADAHPNTCLLDQFLHGLLFAVH